MGGSAINSHNSRIVMAADLSILLYVRNAATLASDSLYFYVDETGDDTPLPKDINNCDIAHPLLEQGSAPRPAR